MHSPVVFTSSACQESSHSLEDAPCFPKRAAKTSELGLFSHPPENGAPLIWGQLTHT